MCAMLQTQACESDQYTELSDFTDEDTDYGQSRSEQRPVRGSTTDSTTDSASFSMPMKVDNGTDKANQTSLDNFLGCAPAEGGRHEPNQALPELTSLIAYQRVWANGSCVSPTKVRRKVKRMRSPSDYGSRGMFAYNSASTDWENESCSTICSAEWTRQPMLMVYVPQLKWKCKQCGTQHTQVQADIKTRTACNASRRSGSRQRVLKALISTHCLNNMPATIPTFQVKPSIRVPNRERESIQRVRINQECESAKNLRVLFPLARGNS